MNGNQYRNGVPLQPNSKGLITPTFTLGSIPYGGGHGQGPIN